MEKKVRKMPRNTKYNKNWEDKVVNDVKIGTWCQKETDTSAKCLPCRKVIDISNKGFSALRVHAGNKYQLCLIIQNLVLVVPIWKGIQLISLQRIYQIKVKMNC